VVCDLAACLAGPSQAGRTARRVERNDSAKGCVAGIAKSLQGRRGVDACIGSTGGRSRRGKPLVIRPATCKGHRDRVFESLDRETGRCACQWVESSVDEDKQPNRLVAFRRYRDGTKRRSVNRRARARCRRSRPLRTATGASSSQCCERDDQHREPTSPTEHRAQYASSGDSLTPQEWFTRTGVDFILSRDGRLAAPASA
jgi:hypothetical protein